MDAFEASGGLPVALEGFRALFNTLDYGVTRWDVTPWAARGVLNCSGIFNRVFVEIYFRGFEIGIPRQSQFCAIERLEVFNLLYGLEVSELVFAEEIRNVEYRWIGWK